MIILETNIQMPNGQTNLNQGNQVHLQVSRHPTKEKW